MIEHSGDSLLLLCGERDARRPLPVGDDGRRLFCGQHGSLLLQEEKHLCRALLRAVEPRRIDERLRTDLLEGEPFGGQGFLQDLAHLLRRRAEELRRTLRQSGRRDAAMPLLGDGEERVA